MSEATNRKLRFKKGRSATFSIDGFSFTIVANEDADGNSRPLDRFARSKSQSALWNAITAGIGIKDKGSGSRVVLDDPQTLEEILAGELPDGPDVTEKTAIRANRSTEDAISNLMHTTLTHLEEGNGNYVRMLFIDFSSAFNTIVPLTLVTKMKALGLNTTLCHWIFDFLTNRSQVVRVGGLTSDSLTISTGAPQGCVLSPLLYNIYTHDCKANSSHTSIIKFADDTVILGLISNNNEQLYLDQVDGVAQWCQSNSLTLNITKTKEMVVDYRRQQQNYSYTPLMISGQPVERVTSFKYLGVHITEDLTWTVNTQYVLKKSRQSTLLP
ncbi:hypothetical protein AALO_G00010540 [Alosa alosa]|uniref:Reverse transcriptase domain-containing protein n=1 Tax=Alosa alosa TaxID=278164 RepID=A0AAV6HJI9_9TELE|nr:hypothetical protein AALO_G00010540 [Alosa alosa]